MKNYLKNTETDRLWIRPINIKDATFWEAWIMDPIATKHFPKEIVGSTEKSLEWVQRILDRYNSNRFGFHALIEKSSGNFIGMCGLLLQDINGNEELEVGYSLLRKYWNNGYASEASKHFIKIGFNNYRAESIISIISPENIKSIKVALKNNMTKEESTIFHNTKVNIYRIQQKDFNNLHV